MLRGVIMNIQKNIRIVLTGGPGGGKTTALDLFRRELNGEVTVVPEAATMLFSGGLQRSDDLEVIKCIQTTIFNLQKSLENIKSSVHPHRLLLCDRGTLDGHAYWPQGGGDFFEQMNTTLEDELGRYDAVIFFETSAASGGDLSSNNPIRTESNKEACELDKKLQDIWSKHPNYHFVASSESFIKKIMYGVKTIERAINEHQA
jgi:predicted ATPase